MAKDSIVIKGARVHNLKNVDLEIPRDKLIVFTGLSGSGKSSLAFDTIFAEGNRRFVESLSSYARMFLGQVDKPDVDSIEGLSPSISIDQKTTSKNPRSTVGTVTEIYDYLRLLYARVGIPHCPHCGKEIRAQTVDQIVDKIMELPEGTRFQVLSPVVRGKKGRHEKVFDEARENGFVRVKVDGYVYDLSEVPELDKNQKHEIEIVVDRLVMKKDLSLRLSGSVETALKLSGAGVVIDLVDKKENENKYLFFTTAFACEEHNFSIVTLQPRMFSFNNPYGACPECDGLGVKPTVSPQRLIPDLSKSLADGGIVCNGFKTMKDNNWSGILYKQVIEPYGCNLKTPFSEYPPEAMKALLYGTGEKTYVVPFKEGSVLRDYVTKFPGVINKIMERYRMFRDSYYEEFFEDELCPKCHGQRLREDILAVTVGGINIAEFCDLSVEKDLNFIDGLKFTEKEAVIAKEIIKEIRARLEFLKSVGLGYLTLSRKSGTLSGGESQRIRLATQIGSGLVGVLYILDEPSIGLHQRDNTKLIGTLKKLRDTGNTVIVVEHDTETIESADYIVDIGPGAGVHGGEVVAAGTLNKICRTKKSITGQYLSGEKCIEVPLQRREGNGKNLIIRGACQNNLKNIDVTIPLGKLVCITGVSGSGKSSLINGILFPYLARNLNRANIALGQFDAIEGIDALDKVIAIDQSPIGRTPRSNPATYTGLFTEIRNVFAKTQDAKMRAFGPDRFSFNLKGGRCEACQGDGTVKIEMHFLPDVYVNCDVCHGKRYNRETLEVKYKGKSIADVLDMTVSEARIFFDAIPSIARKLRTMEEVGLGYVKLGQSSTTLSGGEAQRVKLSLELSRRDTGRTVYILDEPTTGLHTDDVNKLCSVLDRLTDAGNSVIVIEHNLDVIKRADHIIDLGPEGGDGGGKVICQGTPEEVANCPDSYTGQYLSPVLKNNQ
ncbi:MAG: excinuclease ABC subunit UvrA [Clostridia bacterium]|nr:excinuclease ABC subunit UvrA [Clostridia bacterium]